MVMVTEFTKCSEKFNMVGRVSHFSYFYSFKFRIIINLEIERTLRPVVRFRRHAFDPVWAGL